MDSSKLYESDKSHNVFETPREEEFVEHMGFGGRVISRHGESLEGAFGIDHSRMDEEEWDLVKNLPISRGHMTRAWKDFQGDIHLEIVYPRN